MSAVVRRLFPRRGATTVELTLVLPILRLNYFALIEFGHAYTTRKLIKSAARKAREPAS